MRKKTCRIAISLVFCMAVGFFASVAGLSSCSFEAPGAKEEAEPAGRALIRLEEAPAGRTVLPDISLAAARYEVAGTGPGGATFELSSERPWVRAELSAGTWNLSARALNQDGLVLLAGSAAAEVAAGAAPEIVVPLSPVEGNGSLAVAFETGAPAGISAALDATAGGFSDNRTHVTASGPLVWASLPSGYYRLVLRADGSSDAPGLAEVVRVVAGARTSFVASFDGAAIAIVRPSGADAAPLEPRLPAWTRRSASEPFCLAPRGLPPDCALSVLADGGVLPASADGVVAAGLLAPGRRRLDVLCASASGARAGSAAAFVDVHPGVEAGPWTWLGSVAPALPEDGPAQGSYGFRALAASADGAILAALDHPAAGTAASALFFFDAGSSSASPALSGLWASASRQARAVGSPRNARRLALSSDGLSSLCWNDDGSWCAWSGAASSATIDQAAAGGALRVRGAAFSSSNSSVYVLSGSPNRILEFDLSGSTPVLARTAALEFPELSGASFSELAADPSGGLLVLSSSADAAAYLPPSLGTAVLVRRTAVPWLDGPAAAVPLAPGAFLVLCPASQSVGRLDFAGPAGGTDFAHRLLASGIPELAEAAFLAAGPSAGLPGDPAASPFAVSGSRSSPSGAPVLVFAAQGGSPEAVFRASTSLPGLDAAGACVWLGPAILAVADGSSRSIAVFGRSP